MNRHTIPVGRILGIPIGLLHSKTLPEAKSWPK